MLQHFLFFFLFLLGSQGVYQKYEQFLKGGKNPGEACDILGFRKYCCRRMFMTHVNLIDELLEYEENSNLNEN